MYCFWIGFCCFIDVFYLKVCIEVFFLIDFKIFEVNVRVLSLEVVESGSDIDRDEVKLVEEMVGGCFWLDGEWFVFESEILGY